MEAPETYTAVNETGCCADLGDRAWDRQVVHFHDKRFIRMHTRSLFFVPMNMTQVMTQIQQRAEAAGASMPPPPTWTRRASGRAGTGWSG